MAAELIGLARCPCCKSDKARLTLAKTGLPVMTCNGCNFQAFARSDRSDLALRSMLVKPAEQAPPVEAPAPAPVPEPAPNPTPAPATAPVPQTPAATGGGWGFFR